MADNPNNTGRDDNTPDDISDDFSVTDSDDFSVTDSDDNTPDDISDEILAEIRLEGEKLGGIDLEPYVRSVLQKIREAEPFIHKLVSLEDLFAETLKASARDFASLDEGEREKIASSIERASASTGNPVSLRRDSENLYRQVQQIHNDISKKLPDARNVVRRRRDDIQNDLATAPQIEQFIAPIQEYQREQELERSVQDMSVPDMMNSLTETQQNRALRLPPDEGLDFLIQRVLDNKRTRYHREQLRRDEIISNAQISEEVMRGKDDETFRQIDLPNIMNRGHATPEEARDYLEGRQSKDEFLDQFGPDISAGYFRAKITPDVIDDANGPGGPLDPGQGFGGDNTPGPIDVRVVNEDTDPVPVIGVGGAGGGGPGGGPAAPQRRNIREDDLQDVFNRQEIGNILAGITDLATPGGQSMSDFASGTARTVARLAPNIGRAAVPHLPPQLLARLGVAPAASAGAGAAGAAGVAGAGGGLGAAGAGAAGAAAGAAGAGAAGAGLGGAALAGGAIAAPIVLGAGAFGVWNNLAQRQQAIERQFGTEQSINPNPWAEDNMFESGLLQAQAQARLSHFFLSGEQIESLTSAMAEMGMTAEETAEALGPVSDAVARYRGLSETNAVRASQEGINFSRVGAANAEVLGAVLESVSGGGFGGEYIQQTAQEAGEKLNVFGNEGGQYLAAGLMRAYQGEEGQDPLDRAVQEAGIVNQDIDVAAAIRNNPDVANTITSLTGNTDILNMRVGSPEFQNEAAASINRIVEKYWTQGPLELDEEGVPIIEGQNDPQFLAANYIAQMISSTPGMPQADANDVLLRVAELQENGGVEGMMQESMYGYEEQERQDQRIKDEAAGSIQERAHDEFEKQGGDPEDVPAQGPWNALRDTLYGITSIESLKPDTFEKGGPGSIGLFSSTDETWQAAKGGFVGAISSQGGVETADIMTSHEGMTLAEVAQDPELLRQVEEGTITLAAGNQMLTAQEVSEGLREGSMHWEQGAFGWGGEIAMGAEGTDNSGGGPVQIEFTDEARQFFQSADPKNRYNNAGNVTDAQDSEDAGRGNRHPADIGKPYGP